MIKYLTDYGNVFIFYFKYNLVEEKWIWNLFKNSNNIVLNPGIINKLIFPEKKVNFLFTIFYKKEKLQNNFNENFISLTYLPSG